MKRSAEFRVPLSGMKQGIHYRNFEVGDAFFQTREESLVESGKVFVDLKLEVRSKVITLNFDLGGLVHTECDRCLASVDMPLAGTFTVYAKPDRGEEAGSEDVIQYSPDDPMLELDDLIHEFVQLSIPMVRNCRELPEKERPCNEEIIRRLEGRDKDEQPVDPRWEGLRALESESGESGS